MHVSRALAADCADLTHDILERGQVQLLPVTLRSGKLILLVNMHIFELAAAKQRRVAALIRDCTSQPAPTVTAKPLLVVGGDLNFHSAADPPHQVVDGRPPRPLPLRPRPQWLAGLDALLEVEQTSPSHLRTVRRPGLAPETTLCALDHFLMDLPTS